MGGLFSSPKSKNTKIAETPTIDEARKLTDAELVAAHRRGTAATMLTGSSGVDTSGQGGAVKLLGQ